MKIIAETTEEFKEIEDAIKEVPEHIREHYASAESIGYGIKFVYIDNFNTEPIIHIPSFLAESTNVNEAFDLEAECDKIYDRCLSLGFKVERSIVVGIVTFVIDDPVFTTYVDMYYGENGIREFILNIMWKIPGHAGATALGDSYKCKTIDEVFTHLTPDSSRIPQISNT